jgi:hypothetical protein
VPRGAVGREGVPPAAQGVRGALQGVPGRRARCRAALLPAMQPVRPSIKSLSVNYIYSMSHVLLFIFILLACDSCSFHAILEFDDAKRSCRRRLAGHNERRRKGNASEAMARGAGHPHGTCVLSARVPHMGITHVLART